MVKRFIKPIIVIGSLNQLEILLKDIIEPKL
jgi:hypothetical protein